MGCASSSAVPKEGPSLWPGKSKEAAQDATPVTSVEVSSAPFGASSAEHIRQEDEESLVERRGRAEGMSAPNAPGPEAWSGPRPLHSQEGVGALKKPGKKKGCLSGGVRAAEEEFQPHLSNNRFCATRRGQSVEWSLRFAPDAKAGRDADDLARRAAMGFARKRSNSVMQWTVAADEEEADLSGAKEEHDNAGTQCAERLEEQ